MDNMEEIAALNAEARRRGTSYGKLISATTQPERWEIVQRYKRSKAAQERRKRTRSK